MAQDPLKQPWWEPAAQIFGQVSTWVVVPIVLALIAGKWLDGHFGTRPWIFLGLSCVGFFISTFGIVHTVTAYLKSTETETKNHGNPNEPTNSNN